MQNQQKGMCRRLNASGWGIQDISLMVGVPQSEVREVLDKKLRYTYRPPVETEESKRRQWEAHNKRVRAAVQMLREGFSYEVIAAAFTWDILHEAYDALTQEAR